MPPLLFAIAIIALIVMAGFWLRRERTSAAAAVAVRNELIARYDLDEAYVSGEDDSLIGLSFATRQLLFGTIGAPQRLPFDALRAVEGLRDGVVMVRTARDGAPLAPTNDASDLPPHTVRSLALRITVDGPEPGVHTILFADGGKQGLDPQNMYLRQQAVLTEAWYGRLVKAMQEAVAGPV